ncbi:nickel-binding protein [Saccharicrinis sp. FJH62]|uniref:nickel-binding protein n=1 Tax=Saccharicrinis sp. FJH62 TaxID=3344657 RepID=UPI0035D46483
MPIYMDRHDVSETVTAENVAWLHQQDLKVEHQFNCRGLTYWFDEKRKIAFCLIEAPKAENIHAMHNVAHGEVPHTIIEVDATIVESFLGRIEDPEYDNNTEFNIINDPAFRTVMLIRIKTDNHETTDSHSLQTFLTELNLTIKHSEGRVVEQNTKRILISFKSVTKAVLCAVEVYTKVYNATQNNNLSQIKPKICLDAGLPVTGRSTFFEETIQKTERFCNVYGHKIVISAEVKDLYKSENMNAFIETEDIAVLPSVDELFLNHLMDFIEQEWQNSEITVAHFNKTLGMSKSNLYRKMIELTGKSPNTFLKEYRLNKSLELIQKNLYTISEIAFNTGFSSLSYFSKCFQKRYNLVPTEYIRTLE